MMVPLFAFSSYPGANAKDKLKEKDQNSGSEVEGIVVIENWKMVLTMVR